MRTLTVGVMRRLIAHLDADCFYCSAERVRFRALNGVPIGVLGNQGACVIAKSYEMKAAGVQTGTPIWDAVKLCPEGVYIKRDFRWYEVLSRRMLDVVRSISPIVEYYSIDEFFFDATALPFPDGPAQLQQRILSAVGVPVTIGVSLSRSLAKLISDRAKPFGCKVQTDGLDEFLSTIPVDDITGIGHRSAAKLKAHGIKTCFDYTQTRPAFIRKLLTIKGEKIWHELRGVPCDPINTKRPAHKMISRGGSLGGATDDPVILKAWAVRNVERLVEELDYHRVYAGRLILWLVFKAGGSWGRKTQFPEPTAHHETLMEAVNWMLSQYRSREKVSHMHLLAEQLAPRGMVQRTLFDRHEGSRTAAVKAAINTKIGRFALRSGETLHLPELYKDDAHNYDICDVREKSCF